MIPSLVLGSVAFQRENSPTCFTLILVCKFRHCLKKKTKQFVDLIDFGKIVPCPGPGTWDTHPLHLDMGPGIPPHRTWCWGITLIH